jgi:hypothetical protein
MLWLECLCANEDDGICLEHFKDYHNKFEYQHNVNHIFIFCRHYKTSQQNLNEVWLKL